MASKAERQSNQLTFTRPPLNVAKHIAIKNRMCAKGTSRILARLSATKKRVEISVEFLLCDAKEKDNIINQHYYCTIRLDDDVAKSQQIMSDKRTDKQRIYRIKSNIRKIS